MVGAASREVICLELQAGFGGAKAAVEEARRTKRRAEIRAIVSL
eukprot:CAMPEP_0119004682 /NCGR_PEP_ID=MMETSP1176-20130426/1290_1 /TAXON_ID=265551 /ORGANISM="Synedropsis recta cf, Strain CCMP1620" /LENGTH=43 /DNA_ID= /DNA_START= /DNA_END= /DNA_ORIENTATION=